jgi:hypothetical protein
VSLAFSVLNLNIQEVEPHPILYASKTWFLPLKEEQTDSTVENSTVENVWMYIF